MPAPSSRLEDVMGIAERAMFYARRGLAVFPLWTIEDGRCSCGDARCSSPGKHPIGSLVPHGVLDAQADEKAALEWWTSYHDANIGIATGDASRIVVLDVDVDKGGADTLDNLVARNGEVPDTWSVRTGGGGFHVWFRMPLLDVRNSGGAIGPGVDVRGNGGYVVAPPSKHVSGGVYRWDEEFHPTKVELAEPPEWLVRLMVPGPLLRSVVAPLPKTIAEGTRNTWMASVAGSLRRRGLCEESILAALKIENKLRCKPPLDERELRRVARSIERYAPEPVVTVGGRMAQ